MCVCFILLSFPFLQLFLLYWYFPRRQYTYWLWFVFLLFVLVIYFSLLHPNPDPEPQPDPTFFSLPSSLSPLCVFLFVCLFLSVALLLSYLAASCITWPYLLLYRLSLPRLALPFCLVPSPSPTFGGWGGGYLPSLCLFGSTFRTHSRSHGRFFLVSVFVLSHLLIVLMRESTLQGGFCPRPATGMSGAWSCLVLSGLVLSCLVLSCLVLSGLVLSCLILSCFVSSRLVLPCLVLSCLVSPCPALPCLVLWPRVWNFRPTINLTLTLALALALTLTSRP
jgi:hypothetical protein